MKIYNYHPVTKILIGESIADKSPIERDVWLFPADSTIKKPPTNVENKIIVFNETIEEWELLDQLIIEYPVPDSDYVMHPYKDQIDLFNNLDDKIKSLERNINLLEQKYNELVKTQNDIIKK